MFHENYFQLEKSCADKPDVEREAYLADLPRLGTLFGAILKWRRRVFRAEKLPRPHGECIPFKSALLPVCTNQTCVKLKIDLTVHTQHARPMQAGVFDVDVKRSFHREFRLTRIPHTQTLRGSGGGGGGLGGGYTRPREQFHTVAAGGQQRRVLLITSLINALPENI